MQTILYVIFNEKVVLEFDRNKTLPATHRQYLDNMDARMDEGINFEGQRVNSPNPLQKAQFVANLMLNGLLNNDSNQAIAMCTYLGDRIPDLKQITCNGQNDATGIQIAFVYDQESKQAPKVVTEQTIKFFDPKDYMKH